MNKILLVEDDNGISNSLKLYLENSNFEVNIHATGEGAVNKILNGDYSAVILDVNLPVMNGIDICKEVRATSQIPILMLTARTSEMDRIIGLEIGADDYIPKPFSPRELLARINVILRRVPQEKINSGIMTVGNIEINSQKRLVTVGGKLEEFTKNEYEILLKIFEENGNVVSREVLMKEVIGYDRYVYDRTLDTHIKNVRKKIKDKDLILTVRGQGYRLNK